MKKENKCIKKNYNIKLENLHKIYLDYRKVA